MENTTINNTTPNDKRITIYVKKEEYLDKLDDAYQMFIEARGAFKISKSQFYSHLLMMGLDTLTEAS